MKRKPKPIGEVSSPPSRASRTAKPAARSGETFPQADVDAALKYVSDALQDRSAEIADLRSQTDKRSALSAQLEIAEAERDAARAELDKAAKAKDRALTLVKSARAERDDLGSRLEQVQDELAEERATAARLKDQIEAHRRDMDALRLDLRLAEHASTSAPPTAPDPPPAAQLAAPPAQVQQPPIASSREITDPVAHAFLTWCRQGGGLVGRAGQFQTFLAGRVPGAEVTRTDRDADSPVRPIRLRPGGVSPVEHWVVSFEGRAMLLPHPLGPGQFREIGPCFDGHATPATLRDIVPAALRAIGSDYELVAPGRVEG